MAPLVACVYMQAASVPHVIVMFDKFSDTLNISKMQESRSRLFVFTFLALDLLGMSLVVFAAPPPGIKESTYVFCIISWLVHGAFKFGKTALIR